MAVGRLVGLKADGGGQLLSVRPLTHLCHSTALPEAAAATGEADIAAPTASEVVASDCKAAAAAASEVP